VVVVSPSPPNHVEVLARGLLRRGNDVLVCRDVRHGHCYLPGGHVDPGESAPDAVAREFEEECEWGVAVGPPLLVWESRFVQRGALKHEWTAVFHVERAGGGDLAHAPASRESHLAFEWISATELLAKGFVPEPVGQALAQRSPVDRSIQWLSIDDTG
jgi:8-oxo-dGTP pyrophosphatase MutT (NUDIX family)